MRDKVNLYDVIPLIESHISWQKKNDGMVEVIVPRFKRHWMRRLFKNLGRDPDIHISLDPHGSAVWMLMDGKSQVKQIVNELAEHFNNEETYESRVLYYLSTLQKNRLIRYVIKKENK